MIRKDLVMEVGNHHAVGRENGYTLHGYVWTPDTIPVTSVIHVVHGMTEHMGRYEKFAERMTEVGIAVAGYDLRGHGRNAGDPNVASFISGAVKNNAEIGIKDYGWKNMVWEVRRASLEIRGMFPEADHYIMGFSLGSFLVRDCMIEGHLSGLKGIILMGTGFQPSVITSLMQKLIFKEIKLAGEGKTTDKVKDLAFGTYNKKFIPIRTDFDWLCSDANELCTYMNDPLVRKDISADLFYEMIGSINRTCKKSGYYNSSLQETPVLLISGWEDPVGGMGNGVKSVYKLFKCAGLRRVKMIRIAKSRHDLLHEYENGGACSAIIDIINWIGGTKVGCDVMF